MKKIIFIILIIVLALPQAFSQKLATGAVTSSFVDKSFRTIIMPPAATSTNSATNPIAEVVYNEITNQLAGLMTFIISGDFRSVRKKTNAYKYGGLENTDVETAIKIAKSMKGEAVIVAKASNTKPVIIDIQIYSTEGTLLYTGKGRASKASSTETDTKTAVNYALKKLKKKIK